MAGLGLAGAAFFVLYSRREEPPADEAAPAPEPEEEEEAIPPLPPKPAPTPPPAAETIPGPTPEELRPTIPVQPTVPTPAEPPEAATLPGGPPMTDQPPSPSGPQSDRSLFPVVTLLRDDVTGELVLQIGSRTYRNAAELKESADWTRVEYAARDLARWIEGGAPPTRKAEPRYEEPATSGSMVQQINQILEKKLAAQPGLARGVRLAEGPGGAVRVYIGVQAYSLEEVPDPAVRSIIREAVAEWEARS